MTTGNSGIKFSKFLKVLLFVGFMTIAIVVLKKYFGMTTGAVVAVVFYGLSMGLLFSVVKGFVVPGKWIRNNSFLIYGIVLGLVYFVFMVLTNLVEGNPIPGLKVVAALLASLLVGLVLGLVFFRWNYRVVCKQTRLDLKESERILLEDTAFLSNEDSLGRGRLLLTSERLVFIFLDVEKENFEINAKDIKTDIQIIERYGIPNGIKINDTSFIVKFPLMWKRDIQGL